MSKGIFSVVFVVYSSFDEGGGEQSSKLSTVRGGAQELGRSIGEGGSKQVPSAIERFLSMSRFSSDCVGERRDSVHAKICMLFWMSREIGRVQILRSATRGWVGSSEAVKDFPG